MRYAFFGMALVGWTAWNAAPAHAQPNTLTKEEIADGWILGFDGTSTTGWNIQGDAKVVDRVLVLGGAGPTRAQVTPLLGSVFELRFEYRTEGKVSNTGWETRTFLGRSYSSVDLDRQSKDAEEWIEIIYKGEFDPANGMRSVKSQCRTLGEPAFVARGEIMGTTATGSMSVTFEIPAGSRLHLRNVKLHTEPRDPTYASVWVIVVVGVAVAAFGTLLWIQRPRRLTTPVARSPGSAA